MKKLILAILCFAFSPPLWAADVKISDLPAATSVGSTDIVPIVQSGTTKKATVDLLPAALGILTTDTGTSDNNATPTIATGSNHLYQYILTGMAGDTTIDSTGICMSGTGNAQQMLWIIIIGTGSHDIAWSSAFESSSINTLPTTGAIINGQKDFGFRCNTVTQKWRLIALS